ncbi:MAG TPA: alpha/beta hydrolase [Candidatus Methylomirabilis sp.]|nr:alpha/beta hydrolase [Candidatus Methylomirabilis sp.]
MATLELVRSPHAPEVSPVKIHYREFGKGKPLIFLHGGWGYGVYPLDVQIAAFEKEYRILVPDRSGYGRSSRVAREMALDFHDHAAEETIAVLNVMGIKKAVFWGHSDGAVIGAKIGLRAPGRCERLILEAFHLLKRKPGSRAFFERFAERPEDLGEETKKLLAADHGDDWPIVLRRNCGAWFRIADAVKSADEDLYDGRLGELRVPTMFLHGRLDPRTEPGEMERVQKMLPKARVSFVESGKHSPHSENGTSEECNRLAEEFLQASSSR